MKLELVGELPHYNEYEVQCSLARDVDLSRGTLRPRLDDVTIAVGNIKRVQTADNGIVRYSSTAGYAFAWERDVYWLNGNNSWQRVDSAGNTSNLSAPNAPTIHFVGVYSPSESLGPTNGSWDVTPNQAWPPRWNNVSGNIARIYTFSSARNWSKAAYLWAAIEVPPGADATFEGTVNNIGVPVQFYRADNTFGWLIWDVRAVDCSAVTSVGFSYTLASSHTLTFRYYLDVDFNVPCGYQAYVATLERAGIESVVSQVAVKHISHSNKYRDTRGVIVEASVSPAGQAGDIIRLYRAVDGVYHLVDTFTATQTYTSVYLYDKGDVGEPYRPSGILPFGPALVVGNRVAVASGRTVYLSQPDSPVRFGSIAMNEDNQDAFSVVLPETVVALSVHELGVVAHTRNHQYVIRLQTQHEGDLLHRAAPMKLEAPTARNHRAVWGQLLVDRNGDVWLGNQRLFGGLSGDIHALEVDGRLYIAVGGVVYVSKPSWKGWAEYSVPGTVQWMTTDGVDVFIATPSGVYKLEGANTRKSSCVWRTGKMFSDRISAVRYVHIAGTASTLKLIRPGLSDVVIPNASGRVHVPAGQQTHEWQLEFHVSDEVYAIHLTTEGGVR